MVTQLMAYRDFGGSLKESEVKNSLSFLLLFLFVLLIKEAEFTKWKVHTVIQIFHVWSGKPWRCHESLMAKWRLVLLKGLAMAPKKLKLQIWQNRQSWQHRKCRSSISEFILEKAVNDRLSLFTLSKQEYFCIYISKMRASFGGTITVNILFPNTSTAESLPQ